MTFRRVLWWFQKLKPDDLAKDLQAKLDQDEQSAQHASEVFITEAQTKLKTLQSKLQRLLDGYLDQDIERETYLTKKAELMSEKKSLEEYVSKLTTTSIAWVEPMRKWINKANSICKITKDTDLQVKKTLAKEIFGSNLLLKDKKVCCFKLPAGSSPLKNQWTALRATLQLAASRRESLTMAEHAGLEPFRLTFGPAISNWDRWFVRNRPHFAEGKVHCRG